MIKNGTKILFLFIFLTSYSDVFTRNNETIEKVDKNQLESLPHKSESNVKNQMIQKSASKSRKRMSAGKIAGIISAVLLGVVAVGALIWFGLSLFLLFCGL